ncbi:5-methylcytosine-specific restriction endonuclease system specificity protein McrC [Ruminococcus flavefaciens]|uniref:5-methylcytosine-specific restriction enzyme subunit McrC n=1 Tax=Ruminococcus flavefaciens TaxID=1265 RepID=A0A1K1MHJ7_RUMFL|nr:5-methylcytosine-specific restriction endonuclease system specificity protein McrC [Ruminococcus flavefaciens]SFW22571.1 5-methylcytosine-specific restriction enzyme subunit McrC [Ruminococcus flavefaciens]
MTVDKSIYIKNIYYMLSYAFQILKQEDYRQVAGEKFHKTHDLFAAILEKGVSRQLKQGLYREYVPMQEQLSVMRGKLNINDTLRLQAQREQKLSCEFDEFSEDNLYNQILKVTIHRLIYAEDVAVERKQALKKLIVFLGNVQLIQPDHITWNRLIYQRNNRNYELLLNICYLLLNGMLQTTEDGSYKLISFSDEHMEKLYERFILKYYEQHYPELKPKSAQVKWNLTEQPDETMIHFLPTMQTDITLHKGDKTLIIDAKYYGRSMIENYDKATLRSAHLYQIFAYVKNMDVENDGNVSGLLLYAKTDDEMFPNGQPFIIGGNSIGAKTLDLNQEFKTLSKQLDDIVVFYFQ